MKDNHFFAMMSRMKYIDRWGLMRNTIKENDSEHSLNVAMIAHALGVINNEIYGGSINAERLALLGVFHDVTEIITGDTPTPIKYYNPKIKEAHKELEAIARDELLDGLPEKIRDVYKPLMLETDEEKEAWRYVKAADKISALIKCIEERKMGNADFKEAEETIRKAIDAIELKEVKYFLDNFLPAFDMTIDESRR